MRFKSTDLNQVNEEQNDAVPSKLSNESRHQLDNRHCMHSIQGSKTPKNPVQHCTVLKI